MITVDILGQGGISKLVIEILNSKSKDYSISAIYDDSLEKQDTLFQNILTIGTIEGYVNREDLDKAVYFNCLGNIKAYRKRIEYSKILKRKNVRSINIIHSSVSIFDSVKLEEGNFIGSQVTIESDVNIGYDNVIFSNSTISHDSIIGNLCYLSPSSTLCGKVILDNNVYIGPGAVLTAGVKVGRNSIIGAGSVVLDDVPENSVYVGSPAKFLKINELWKYM